MTETKGDASAVLFESFSAMKRWNDKLHLLMKEDAAAHGKQAVVELEPIFDAYVAPDAVRRDERPNQPSTSAPSDYDADVNTIGQIEEGKSKTVIYVQTNIGFKDRFRFTLIRLDGT